MLVAVAAAPRRVVARGGQVGRRSRSASWPSWWCRSGRRRRRRAGRRRGFGRAVVASEAAGEVRGPADAGDEHEHEQRDRPDPPAAARATASRDATLRRRLAAMAGRSSVAAGSATSSAVATSGTSAVSEASSRVSASSSASSAACISPTSAKRSSGAWPARAGRSPRRRRTPPGSAPAPPAPARAGAARRSRRTTPPVRRPAREAVVEQRAERVDVGAAVERMALRLLGRDVIARPEHAPGVVSAGASSHARDAEVGQLGVAVAPSAARCAA